MSPIYTNEVKVSAIDDELLRLGMPINMPGRTQFGVELTPQEYSRFVELAGNAFKSPISGLGLKDELTELIATSKYLGQSDGEDGGKALEIRTKVQAFRALARAELLEEFEDLPQAVGDVARDKVRALETPSAPFGGITLPNQ